MDNSINKDVNKAKAKIMKQSLKKSKNENKNVCDRQIQVRLVTKDERFTIPDYCIHVNGSATSAELNSLVNKLINDMQENQISFDFLIGSQFLRTSLIEHVTEMEISIEEVVVECIEKYIPPEPMDCIMQDDWISAIDLCENWILTGSYDHMINIWNLKGKHQCTISGSIQPLKAVAWISLDNEKAIFASTSMEYKCIFWRWDIIKNKISKVAICEGHAEGIDALALNHNKSVIATGAWDHMVHIWSTYTEEEEEESTLKRRRYVNSCPRKKPLRRMKGHKHAVSEIVWTDKTEFMTSSWDHTIRIWDSESGGTKQVIHGGNSIFAIDYSPLSRAVITGSADQHVRLYDPRSTEGAIMKTKFTSHEHWVSKVRWSTVNEYIFISTSYDSFVKMWDTRSPKVPLFDLVGHKDKILCCDWSNPKLILSGGADNTLNIFKSNLNQ